ncbi:MAG: tripartite tricarboxylate transporter substrate-binding protein [Lachnospiraceae bacterium]|nr:tripartite tricarboxylate transporter substrate-binding protein [Lachnospiraceae bacterium]
MKKVLALGLSVVMGLSMVTAAAASDDLGWKSGDTVYFDVPAKAGGGTDLMVRYAIAGFNEYLDGVNFVVTNYDTQEVGAQHVAKADPDGYTLTVASSVNMDNYLSGASEVNPVEDLTVLAKIGDGGPQAFIVGPDAPYSTFPELCEYIKENPMQVIVGVALGGTSQLCWIGALNGYEEGLADMVTYVQAGSEADKLTNVASGAIHAGNCSINNADAYQQDGKVKVIGITGPVDKKLADINETFGLSLDDSFLTLPEQGVDTGWASGFYVMGPAGMDEELVKALNAQLADVVNANAYLEGMNAMGQFIVPKTLEESQADFQAEWDAQVELMTGLGMNIRG